MIFRKFFLLLAALIATSAFFPTATLALDDAEFGKMMDSYLGKEENLEKVGKALETYFRKKREEQRKAASKNEEAQMEEQFENPVKIDIGNSPIRGKKDAKITIVEFSDFECPFCARGSKVMDEVLEAYPNDVRVAFKHLPLPFHKNAKPASRAALAAGEQGKFWEMHDKLFENTRSLNEETFVKLAKELGLDVEKFKADLKNNEKKYDEIIDADSALANKLGVRGTPGFFVNGVQVKGARPLPYFKKIIDRWKEKMKG